MEMTPEELADLQESFEYNDLDHDGKIEFSEFVKMLDSLDAEVALEEAKLGFREIDTDKDGAIELDEFIRWWTER
jgi:Ca2+-binding EF-hand superfamily protein